MGQYHPLRPEQPALKVKRYYFFAFFLLAILAAARRSVFLRRAARFLTLSLPWLLPIRPYPHPFPAGSK